MRILLTALFYAASLVLVASVPFFLVLLLAGPHSDMVPGGLHVVTILLGWVSVLALPALAARRA